MSGSGFSGVKQPEFDIMVGKHAQAAQRLERLARALHGELLGAGLDPAPAVRVREIAGRVRRQAEELERRQEVIREMRRRGITAGIRTGTGSFLEVPDRLEAAEALLDGTAAARTALSAAPADPEAPSRLEFARRAEDPGHRGS